MKAESINDNCDYTSPYIIEVSGDSEIKIRVTARGAVPTAQSKKDVRTEFISLVKAEPKKYNWFNFGSVWVELTWYIDAADRQETDAIGDLDNITKPLLDALSGIDGVIIDDSQIKSIYTCWLAKNDAVEGTIAELSVRLLNDDSIPKADTWFVQYDKAMCFAINLNPNKPGELEQIKIFGAAKKFMRAAGSEVNQRFALVASQKDFHRTRLGKIPQNRIFQLSSIL